MTPEDIKNLVLKMRPPTGIYGKMNVEEWMIKKAAELGYMAALCDMKINIGYSYVSKY